MSTASLKRYIPMNLRAPVKKIRDLFWGYNNIRLSTSLSDNQKYPDFCRKASLYSNVFKTFRQNPVYLEILEHVSYEDGLVYIEEIKKQPPVYRLLEQFKENDLWGGAKLNDFPGIGRMSPSTLRYVKVYADLVALFGNLGEMSLCEIGVGYGGQCRVINAASSPTEYTLVDIKPALMLAQTYLDNYALRSVVRYKTMNELETKDYDLFISNYAFTELPRHIQDSYLRKAILNSKRGYITYNDINPASFNSYKLNELLSLIEGSRIIEEIPLSHPNNCIIVWGDKT